MNNKMLSGQTKISCLNLTFNSVVYKFIIKVPKTQHKLESGKNHKNTDKARIRIRTL
jgi:hypothetical protein